ncbi:MAG: fumarate hydratase [Candidatus Schekmanbacteria bacterium]|nr:fumarate hydratase [Candidatus Schekmanbacteria bacterium]
MKKIKVSDITAAIKRMCMESNFELGEDVLRVIEEAVGKEESPMGKAVLEHIKENAEIARTQSMPLCQDTGVAICFADIGQEVHIEGGSFEEAINEGVRQGYTEGYLRKSIVEHPLRRKNTGDNTPAVIYSTIVPGDSLKLSLMTKGGGGDMMSTVRMLTPADGIEGIKSLILDTVIKAGANPCPPIIVGVGIGGTFELAPILAKKSLLRKVGTPSPDPDLAALEKEMLEKINNTGIGPQGYGGKITALAVHIEARPCHIACLPVAVNLNCHSHRHREVIL